MDAARVSLARHTPAENEESARRIILGWVHISNMDEPHVSLAKNAPAEMK
jgi:hypothetical protein